MNGFISILNQVNGCGILSFFMKIFLKCCIFPKSFSLSPFYPKENDFQIRQCLPRREEKIFFSLLL